MALTQTDLDALDTAIASSELRVRLEGRDVTYRSMAELLQARQWVADQVAASSGRAQRVTFRPNFLTQRD